jgi:hypothetical protein
VLDVAFEEIGEADGRAVILLHGFPYDVRAFDEEVPMLTHRAVRVIVPYLRGFGPTRFVNDSTNELLWRTWSPTWDVSAEAFRRSSPSLHNPDFVEVVIHSSVTTSHKRRLEHSHKPFFASSIGHPRAPTSDTVEGAGATRLAFRAARSGAAPAGVTARKVATCSMALNKQEFTTVPSGSSPPLPVTTWLPHLGKQV